MRKRDKKKYMKLIPEKEQFIVNLLIKSRPVICMFVDISETNSNDFAKI